MASVIAGPSPAGSNIVTFGVASPPARCILARFPGTLARRTLGSVDSEPARLLLIEDNARHAQLIQAALGDAGVASAGAPPHEIHHAQTLTAGMEQLATGDVDLVLLDLSLPEGNGLEPLIRLRERFLDIPIVVLTAHGDDLLPGQALQAGAQDFLMKGRITTELLSRTIRHALEVSRLQHALRSLSFLDGLTTLYNRRGFVTLAEPHVKLAQRAKGKFLVFSVEVQDMAAINQAVGYEEGDHVLREVAEILRRCFRDSDLLARLEGGGFVALAADAGPDTATVISERIQRHAAQYNAMTLRSYTLTLTVGCAAFDATEAPAIEDLMARAVETRLGLRPGPGPSAPSDTAP